MYQITKDFGKQKAMDAFKARVEEIVRAALEAEFAKVAMCRTSTEGSGKNYLAAIVGEVEEDGTPFDVCAKIEISIPEWVDRYSSKTGKLWREGFDFASRAQEYKEHVAEKEQKARDKAEKDAKKKAADAAARAKAKAKREGE